MKALVKRESPRKGYEDFLVNAPTVDEFDLLESDRGKGITNSGVRTTGHPSRDEADLPGSRDTSPSIKFKDLLVEEIIPDPDQPRTIFDPTAMDELRESIKKGLLQPITVRSLSSEEISIHSTASENPIRFMIVAGERRWRSVKSLGHPRIAAIISEKTSPLENFLSSLTENLQREDLHPIDEARAYKRILDLEENGARLVTTQSQLASLLGINRQRVSEKLQLLDLPGEALEILFGNSSQQIPGSHGIELLRLNNKEPLLTFCRKIVEEKLSIREIRRQVNELNMRSTLSPHRTKSSFKPIRKTPLGNEGQKGFDLVIKYRSDRHEDRRVIISALEETLDALKKQL